MKRIETSARGCCARVSSSATHYSRANIKKTKNKNRSVDRYERGIAISIERSYSRMKCGSVPNLFPSLSFSRLVYRRTSGPVAGLASNLHRDRSSEERSRAAEATGDKAPRATEISRSEIRKARLARAVDAFSRRPRKAPDGAFLAPPALRGYTRKTRKETEAERVKSFALIRIV